MQPGDRALRPVEVDQYFGADGNAKFLKWDEVLVAGTKTTKVVELIIVAADEMWQRWCVGKYRAWCDRWRCNALAKVSILR